MEKVKKKKSKRRRIVDTIINTLEEQLKAFELLAALPEEDIKWAFRKIQDKQQELIQTVSNTDKMVGFSEKKISMKLHDTSFDDDLPF